MNKKILFGFIIMLGIIFSFTFCLANDNMMTDAKDAARNVVGGAENAIQGATNDISNASKGITNNIENGMNNITNSMKENGDNKNTNKDTNNNNMRTTNNNNNGYVATRTNAQNATFMGMGATTWTWLIMGIAAIAIVALVWYYSTQFTNTKYKDRD